MEVSREFIASLAFIGDAVLSSTDGIDIADAGRIIYHDDEHNRREDECHDAYDNAFSSHFLAD